jgi:hypothetical protein
MKKLVKVTSILGALVMGVSTTGYGVANAASIVSGGNTTATVSLEQDDTQELELTNAPVMDFGTAQIGAKALKLTATSIDDPVSVPNPGKTSGWNVTVNSDGFKDGSGEVSLKGAVLNLDGGVPTPKESDNQSDAPTTAKTIAVDGTGADVNVFTAAAGAGMGEWDNVFTTSNVTLDIPAGNVQGAYTTNLTWTLTNAPE